jgi:hypothetical protein
MRLRRGAGRPEMKQGRWFRRQMRGLWPDRNPLRRTSDRVETCVLAGLFAAAVAAAPFAAHAASGAAYSAALRARQEQLATRHQVRAVLTQRAGASVNPYTLTSEVPVRATWTSVTGARRAGQVMAEPGTPRGASVTIWTDAAGNLTSPPLLPSQAAGQGDLAALGAITGIGLLYACEAAVVRHVLYRRRMAAWDADWAVTAKTWNRQRW